MKPDARPSSAAVDRLPSRWLAWLALGALLATLALEARDALRRSAPPAPVIEVEASTRVIAGIALDDLAGTDGVVLHARARPGEAPRGLLGMSATALRESLGAPDFVRRDGGSQMWRYGSGACTLTVFLHGAGQRLEVAHVEGRGVRSPRDPGFDCADRLVGERRRSDLPG